MRIDMDEEHIPEIIEPAKEEPVGFPDEETPGLVLLVPLMIKGETCSYAVSEAAIGYLGSMGLSILEVRSEDELTRRTCEYLNDGRLELRCVDAQDRINCYFGLPHEVPDPDSQFYVHVSQHLGRVLMYAADDEEPLFDAAKSIGVPGPVDWELVKPGAMVDESDLPERLREQLENLWYGARQGDDPEDTAYGPGHDEFAIGHLGED